LEYIRNNVKPCSPLDAFGEIPFWKVNGKSEMEIGPRYIKGWGGIGWPPETALEQYSELWHIELVLRHFVYAAIRLTYGNEWRTALETVTVREESLANVLLTKAEQSLKEGEFATDTIPDVLWFSTTKELIQVVTNKKNWANCFESHLGEFGVKREDLVQGLDPLVPQRNRWAHFRPLPPEEAQLKPIIDYLNKSLNKWMASKYWNSDPVTDEDQVISEYNKICPSGIRLTNKIHGIYGFIDPERSLDRGLSILLKKNEAKTCYWAELYNVGLFQAWTFDFLREIALALKNEAIHVAIVYNIFVPKGSAKERATHLVSISFPDRSGIPTIVSGLKKISEIMLSYRMPPRKDPNRRTDQEIDLMPEDMIQLMFYSLPFNVLVAPTQEETKFFRVRTVPSQE
jgi:hypothetical protein